MCVLYHCYGQVAACLYEAMITILYAIAMEMIRNDKIVEITEERQKKDVRRLQEVGKVREMEKGMRDVLQS